MNSDPTPTTRADLTQDPATLLRTHVAALRASAREAPLSPSASRSAAHLLHPPPDPLPYPMATPDVHQVQRPTGGGSDDSSGPRPLRILRAWLSFSFLFFSLREYKRLQRLGGFALPDGESR